MKIHWKKVFYFLFLLGSMFGFKNAVGQNDSIQSKNIESNLSENSFQISGVVRDSSDNSPIPFCNVILLNYKNDSILCVQTNFDGYFKINTVPRNVYSIKLSLSGYYNYQVDSILVNKMIELEFKLSFMNHLDFFPAKTSNFDNSFFDFRNTKSGETFDSKEIQRMPGRKPIIIK